MNTIKCSLSGFEIELLIS